MATTMTMQGTRKSMSEEDRKKFDETYLRGLEGSPIEAHQKYPKSPIAMIRCVKAIDADSGGTVHHGWSLTLDDFFERSSSRVVVSTKKADAIAKDLTEVKNLLAAVDSKGAEAKKVADSNMSSEGFFAALAGSSVDIGTVGKQIVEMQTAQNPELKTKLIEAGEYLETQLRNAKPLHAEAQRRLQEFQRVPVQQQTPEKRKEILNAASPETKALLKNTTRAFSYAEYQQECTTNPGVPFRQLAADKIRKDYQEYERNPEAKLEEMRQNSPKFSTQNVSVPAVRQAIYQALKAELDERVATTLPKLDQSLTEAPDVAPYFTLKESGLHAGQAQLQPKKR